MRLFGWWRRRRLQRLQRAAEASAGIRMEAGIDIVQDGAAVLLSVRDQDGLRFYALDDETAYRMARALLKKARRAESSRRAARGRW